MESVMRYGEERIRGGRRLELRREELERELQKLELERWDRLEMLERERPYRFNDVPVWSSHDGRYDVDDRRVIHPNFGPRFGREDERSFFERMRDFFVSFSEDRVPRRLRNKGPKGWKRSDETIYEDICETIDHVGVVDASEVTVRVEGGEVKLEGVVLSRRDKRLLEDIIDSVRGVQDVHNLLRVRHEDSITEKRSDKSRREQIS
jgi:hypothetical protein